jgi:hypothetical protein
MKGKSLPIFCALFRFGMGDKGGRGEEQEIEKGFHTFRQICKSADGFPNYSDPKFWVTQT